MPEVTTIGAVELDSVHALRIALAELGRRQKRIQQIEAETNTEVARIQRDAQVKAEPHKAKCVELETAIECYCAENRDTLLQDDKKSIDLGSGEIGWRKNPLSVKVTNESIVITVLDKLGLERFIKTKVTRSIDKNAAKAARAELQGVAGITFEEGETFYINPL